MARVLHGRVYNDPYSYAQQWNFDVQREMPGGMALSVAYAGSKGTHLPGPDQQLNQLPPEFLSLGSQAAGTGAEPVLRNA